MIIYTTIQTYCKSIIIIYSAFQILENVFHVNLCYVVSCSLFYIYVKILWLKLLYWHQLFYQWTSYFSTSWSSHSFLTSMQTAACTCLQPALHRIFLSFHICVCTVCWYRRAADPCADTPAGPRWIDWAPVSVSKQPGEDWGSQMRRLRATEDIITLGM